MLFIPTANAESQRKEQDILLSAHGRGKDIRLIAEALIVHPSQTLSAYINVSAVQMSLFWDLCFGTVA